MSSKITVAIITPDSGDACSVYRGVGPYSKLDDVELEVFDGKKGFFLWQAMTQCEVIFLQRPWTQQHLSILETAKALGRKVIVEWDDDLSCVPQWNPNAKHFTTCKPILEKCSQLADAVTVTTGQLKHQVQIWGGHNVVVIKNAIDDSLKTMLRPQKRNKMLIWRGSNTHSADLESGRDTFKDFAAKGYQCVFVGDAPAWAYELKNWKKFEVSDYSNFIALLNSLAPEYFFVPLVDCLFNRAKSDIAAQEAYLIGAKLLHSGVGEYRDLPETSEPRWLSEVNPVRLELLKELTSR